MRILTGFVALAVILAVCNTIPSVAQSGNSEYVIVTNKQTAGEAIPRKMLKSIYLREAKSWGQDRGNIIVVDMEGCSDFYQNLFGKSYVQMQAYWMNMRIKYSVDLPVTKKNSADVKQFVSSNKGSIGFIKKSDLDNTVKALEIKE